MSKVIHILQHYRDSELVLAESTNNEGHQILHLFLRYHDFRQNYKLSFETHKTHVRIDQAYKAQLVADLKGVD